MEKRAERKGTGIRMRLHLPSTCSWLPIEFTQVSSTQVAWSSLPAQLPPPARRLLYAFKSVPQTLVMPAAVLPCGTGARGLGGLLIEGGSGLIPLEAAEEPGELRPEKPKPLGCPGLITVDHCGLPAAVQNSSLLLMGSEKQVAQKGDDARVFLEPHGVVCRRH